MKESYQNFIARACHARGQIIGACCFFEKSLDTILATYFSKNESSARELIELLFCTDKINLKSKCTLLIDLLKNNSIYGKHHEALFPSIQQKLTFFREFRNKFAHDAEIIPDTFSDDFYNQNTICLIPLKNVSKSKCYTSDDIEDLLDYIDHIGDLLDKAKMILIGRE